MRGLNRVFFLVYLVLLFKDIGTAATAVSVNMEGKKRNNSITRVRKTYTVNKTIVIPGGTFIMGNNLGEDDEKPAHEVTLDTFKIDAHEVTNAEYEECVKSGKCQKAHYDDGSCNVMTETGWWEGIAPSVFKSPDKPVTCVNYYEAKQYCESKNGRLPTEAQFEYALRAGTKSRYYWGEDPESGIAYANGADLDGKKVFEGVYNNRYPSYVNGHDGGVYTTAVQSYKPNGFGLYDMTGNAWEWCSDWYKGSYDKNRNVNPVGPDTGTHRVVRGGSAESNPDHLASTYRDRSLPFYRMIYNGFRCVYKH